MTSRGAGAGLALIAAALLAVSIATPSVLPGPLALFAGHPTVHGRTFEMQDVYVGLYGAELCNTGGDGACSPREPKSSFQIAALGELGLAGLLGATAVVLALLTLRKSEARKGAARLVRLLALLAAAGVGVLVWLGPTDEGAVPVGFGMGVYGAAVLGALLASVIAARPPPPIKLRVAERRPVAASRPIAVRQTASGRQGPPARQAPAPEPLDKSGRFDDDPPWIGEPRPEPARDARTAATSGGDFAGSSDALAIPLAQPSGDKPLFSSAPHLRPLYDAEPQQGGTGGLLPIERPTLPSRPPTPVSRAQLHETGLPPPAPPAERAKPKTLPPPSFGARVKPPSAPPSIGAPPAAVPALAPPMPESDRSIALPPLPFSQQQRAYRDSQSPPATATPIAQPPGAQTIIAPPPVAAPAAPPVAAPPVAAPPVAAPPVAAPPVAAPPAVQSPIAQTIIAPPPIAPATVRAAVPMPARPDRPAPPAMRPPVPAPAARPLPPPRPTISTSVVPPPAFAPAIPAIPNIPPIPVTPRRPDEITDIEGPTGDGDLDQPTVARVPIEITDNTSKTHVTGAPTIDEHDAADAAGAHALGEVRGSTDFDEAIDTAGRPYIARDVAFVPERAPVAEQVPAIAPAAPASAPLAHERPMPNLPISTAPESLPPPRENKRSTGPSPACPQCESPMAWVEEHLRFYCKSCRMYF